MTLGEREAVDLERSRQYIDAAWEPDFDAWIAKIRQANAVLRAAIIDAAVFRRDTKALRELAAKCRTCNGRGYSYWRTGPDSYENDVCSGCEDVQEALGRLQAAPLADRPEA